MLKTATVKNQPSATLLRRSLCDRPFLRTVVELETQTNLLCNQARARYRFHGGNSGKYFSNSAIKAASFILIPVQPSPYDIWATADLVELVKQRIEVTDGKLQAAFVVSRAIKGTRIGGEVAEALAGYELPILEARITQRVSYPGTAAAGTTVLAAEPEGDAAAEVRALAAEIKQKLI